MSTLSPRPPLPLAPKYDDSSNWLTRWLAHRAEIRNRLAEDLAEELSLGHAIIENSSIMWSMQGTRHSYDHGQTWGTLDQPFIPECRTPEYFGKHIASRVFGFGWSVWSVANHAGICASDTAQVCTHGKQSSKGDQYSAMCNGAHQLKQFCVDFDGISYVSLFDFDEAEADPSASPIVAATGAPVDRADVVAMNVGERIDFNAGASGCGSITRIA